MVLVQGVDGPPELPAMADTAGVALLRSPLPDSQVLDNLQYFASLFLSEQTTLHGVFMEIFTIGVLITGGPWNMSPELGIKWVEEYIRTCRELDPDAAFDGADLRGHPDRIGSVDARLGA